MLDFINNRYGSKKGFLKLLLYNFFQLFGKYNSTLKVDFSRVKRFVFVCSGNICRSALADCVMNKLGGESISFGLNTSGGHKADPRMVCFAKEHVLDLSAHETKSVNQYLPQPGDLLIGMEPSHVETLMTQFPELQITFLGVWLHSKKIYLHDPYNTNMKYFNRCAEQIVEATEKLYRVLQATKMRQEYSTQIHISK